MRLTAATLAAFLLAAVPGAAGAMPLAAPEAFADASARLSQMQQAAFVCHRWQHGPYWVRRCWWANFGPSWPPTWRGSGWRGPGWYGAGWRKHYFTVYGGH